MRPEQGARAVPVAQAALDVQRVRGDFPILSRSIRGRRLVYLDNAASTQKPRQVIDAIARFYSEGYANIHRGVHLLSQEATAAFEAVRERVRATLHARDAREIVFVRGTTEAVNLVARTFGRMSVAAGDEVVVTAMEHHSNLVPWQMLCEDTGARLCVAPFDDRGDLMLDSFERLLSPRTRLVAVTHVSNALGTVNPIRHLIEIAHRRRIPVLVDGAQAVPRMRVDVQALDCDFYTFSGHKVYGPTGIGVLYGKAEHLEAMPPWQGGGDMVRFVTFEKTTYNHIPHKFEAGTPDIAGAIGLGAALDYLDRLGLEAVEAHDRELLAYAQGALARLPGLRLIGEPAERAGAISFVLAGIHAHDIGTVLDMEGVAVRTGHHCAHPVMERYGVPATVRASVGVHNGADDIDALVAGLHKVSEIFG